MKYAQSQGLYIHALKWLFSHSVAYFDVPKVFVRLIYFLVGMSVIFLLARVSVVFWHWKRFIINILTYQFLSSCNTNVYQTAELLFESYNNYRVRILNNNMI